MKLQPAIRQTEYPLLGVLLFGASERSMPQRITTPNPARTKARLLQVLMGCRIKPLTTGSQKQESGRKVAGCIRSQWLAIYKRNTTTPSAKSFYIFFVSWW
jgi:hypothetical protein